jgi:hypothetical protein
MCDDRKNDKLLGRCFVRLEPARTDFDALGRNADVGLAVRSPHANWHGSFSIKNADGAQVTLVEAIISPRENPLSFT